VIIHPDTALAKERAAVLESNPVDSSALREEVEGVAAAGCAARPTLHGDVGRAVDRPRMNRPRRLNALLLREAFNV
jgi:hypothetical protein